MGCRGGIAGLMVHLLVGLRLGLPPRVLLRTDGPAPTMHKTFGVALMPFPSWPEQRESTSRAVTAAQQANINLLRSSYLIAFHLSPCFSLNRGYCGWFELMRNRFILTHLNPNKSVWVGLHGTTEGLEVNTHGELRAPGTLPMCWAWAGRRYRSFLSWCVTSLSSALIFTLLYPFGAEFILGLGQCHIAVWTWLFK